VLSHPKFETQQNVEKGEFLLNIMESYSSFIESSLSVCLDDNRTKNDVNNNENDEALVESDENDDKKKFKSFEESIECKLLALEIVKSISGFFSKEIESNEDNESEEEIWEDCDSDEEMVESSGRMDIEMEETNTNNDVESNSDKKLINIIKKQNLFELLIKTIKLDNENVYQDANRIEHIYESIKFIKMEACSAYSLLFKISSKKDHIEELNIEKDLVDLLDYINKTFNEEDYTQEEQKVDSKVTLKYVELIYDLYMSLSSGNKLSMEAKIKILALCKDIVYKYKGFNIDVTARLVKIFGSIAIKERDTNLNEGLPIIQVFYMTKILSFFINC
jgi:hypothetical protein